MSNSSVETYGGQGGHTISQLHNHETGSLPFTGLDVFILLGGAVILGCTGAALSKLIIRIAGNKA